MSSEYNPPKKFYDLLGQAPAIIAIGGVYGLAVSLCHQFGFYFIGHNMWAFFIQTPSDYANKAVGPTIFGATAALATSPLWFLVIRTSQNVKQTKRYIWITALVLLGIAFYFGYNAFGRYPNSTYARILGTFLGLVLACGCTFAVWLIESGRTQRTLLVPIWMVVPFFAAFSVGAVSGADMKRCYAATIFTVGDHNLTKSISAVAAFPLDRGVAAEEANGQHSLIPWSMVARLVWSRC